MNVERQIVAHGKVERGRLGITIQEINQSLADSFGLSKPGGALVASVESGSPAAKAGIETGDVILGIDGQSIENSGELPAIVAAKRPGEQVHLQVWRANASRNIDVKVGAFSEEKLASADTPDIRQGRLGVAVRPLSPQEKRDANVSEGMFVEQASGAAAKAGIQPGDIILSVNGQPTGNIERLKQAVSSAGKKAAVLVDRGNNRLFIPVDLG